MYAYSN